MKTRTDPPIAPNAWQYHLVWTPGPTVSTVQLWASTRMGTRNLWDQWEVPAHAGIPKIADVLTALYSGVVEAQERSTHLL